MLKMFCWLLSHLWSRWFFYGNPSGGIIVVSSMRKPRFIKVKGCWKLKSRSHNAGLEGAPACAGLPPAPWVKGSRLITSAYTYFLWTVNCPTKVVPLGLGERRWKCSQELHRKWKKRRSKEAREDEQIRCQLCRRRSRGVAMQVGGMEALQRELESQHAPPHLKDTHQWCQSDPYFPLTLQ